MLSIEQLYLKKKKDENGKIRKKERKKITGRIKK